MTDFTRAISLSDLAENTPTLVTVNGHEIALVRQGDCVHALNDACSHAEVSLSDGGHIEDGCIVCPAHCGSFHLDSGEACDPPADEPVRIYEVRIDGDDVLVKA